MKRFLSILLLVLCSISALGQNSPNKLAGHEFVDLGLPSRTLWATCNVGASSPEEFGDHFAWGETTPKNEYALKNYKYYVSGGSKRKKVILSKYVTSSEHGEVDNKRRLDTSDDVAHTSWGSDWRMPTSAELEELSNECTWTWTTRGGRYGYKVTGKNGSWIFLPAAGIRDGKNLIDPGYKSAYWTSELSSSAKPSHLYICGDYMHEVDLTEYSGLHYGFSVRPVFKKASADSGNSKSSTGSGSKSAGGTGVSSDTKQTNTTKSGTGSSSNANSSSAAKTAASSGSTKTAGNTGSSTDAKSTASSNPASTTMAVDLGLSVKWASCNLGANKPEEHGDYFAWGETRPKSTYTWDSLKYFDGSSGFRITKYNTMSDYGPVDNKIRLDPSDDAASVKLGGKWRTPTDSDWAELKLLCKWEWTSVNGVEGRRVTGPNGNSIFLPVTGQREGSTTMYSGEGIYWSSSLVLNDPGDAWFFSFGEASFGRHMGLGRKMGYAIRPVTD